MLDFCFETGSFAFAYVCAFSVYLCKLDIWFGRWLRDNEQGWNTVVKDAKEHELTVGEYTLKSDGAEWLTPHIQSFSVNSTGDDLIDRVRFEVSTVFASCVCVCVL